MDELEVSLYIERLPILLDHLSSSVDRIQGMGAAAIEDLRTGLGIALAAAERLRAERRVARIVVH